MSQPDDSAAAADNRKALLRLANVPGVGSRLRHLLLGRFGSAAAVLAAAPSDLRQVPGVGPKIARAIHDGAELNIDGQLDLCARRGVEIVIESDAGYPRGLHDIADPPACLFVRGSWLPQDNLGVAIVGSRHATNYGLAQAERLAGSLARAGLTIVSGLARGIDGAAHAGALDAGGRTVAVLGSGVLNIYPPEHTELASRIIGQGALLGEQPVTAAPFAGAFPQRNRLISGMSLGVIVVEAADHSGALITARLALEQGREVFAVPGRVDSRMSRGCHRLLKDGARLVENAEDVLEELGPLVGSVPDPSGQEVHHPVELLLNEMERQVLAAIESDGTTVDRVVAATGLATGQVLAILSVLEMRRVIRRLSGSLVARI